MITDPIFKQDENSSSWDQVPLPHPVRLNRDGSLVPCFGEVILRILSQHKNAQLSRLIGLVSDIAQCFFQDYSLAIEELENQIHYQTIKCEEVMANLEETIGKDEKVLEEENNKAEAILESQELILKLSNSLNLLIYRRERVYPILQELLLSFETALGKIKQMSELQHPEKPTSYSSTLYYSYAESLQIEEIPNYLVKLKQSTLIAQSLFGTKGEAQKEICKQLVHQESQNWLHDQYNAIEGGKYKVRSNEGICFDCKWSEYWGNQNQEIIIKRELTNEPIAIVRENQIQEMENNFKLFSAMKQPLAIVLHCSNLSIQFRILQTSLISRLVLGRCSFSLSGWAILISLISRMPYLGYLSIIACSIDESPRHYARADILQALAHSNSLQYLNLSKSIFGQPRFGPLPQMTGEEYLQRHPCNFLTKELASRATHSYIIHLDLSDQYLGEVSGIKEILLNSKQSSFLQRLILRGNSLSDYGALHISQALKSNSYLIYLDLARNNVTWKGFQALGVGLELNASLQFLILDENKIEYEEKPEDTPTVVEAVLLQNESLKMVSFERTPHNFIYKTKRYEDTKLKAQN